jgi:outer membrane biogenesis lipoprotein LolB
MTEFSSTTGSRKWLPGAALAGVALLLLAACDSGPEGRPLNYDKGTYLGKKDQPLSEDTLQELRERVSYQAYGSGSETATTSVRVGVTGTNVRPPQYGER